MLLHFISKKKQGRKDFVAMKLDMSNTYDRVEMSFLQKLMDRMGFNSDLITSIMDPFFCAY